MKMINAMDYNDFYQIICVSSSDLNTELPGEFVHRDMANKNLNEIKEAFESKPQYQVEEVYEDEYTGEDGIKVTNKSTGVFFVYYVRHNYQVWVKYHDLRKLAYGKRERATRSLPCYW